MGEWKSQGQWTAHRGLEGWKEQQRKKQRGGRRTRQVRADGVRRGVRESTWASDVDRGIKESAKGPQWTHILSVCVCVFIVLHIHCTLAQKANFCELSTLLYISYIKGVSQASAAQQSSPSQSQGQASLSRCHLLYQTKKKSPNSTLLLLSGIWMFAKLPVLTSSVWQCVYVLSLGHIECLDLTAGGVMALPLTHMVTHTQQQRRKCWSSMTQDFDVTNPCPINPCVCVRARTQGCRLCYSVLACFCCCQCIYCCFLLLLFSPSFLPLFFFCLLLSSFKTNTFFSWALIILCFFQSFCVNVYVSSTFIYIS